MLSGRRVGATSRVAMRSSLSFRLVPASLSFSGKMRSGVAIATMVAMALTVSACNGNKNRPKLAYEERPVELLYNTTFDLGGIQNHFIA